MPSDRRGRLPDAGGPFFTMPDRISDAPHEEGHGSVDRDESDHTIVREDLSKPATIMPVS